MADTFVLSKFVVNKVLEVAQACVDDSRKGWRVKMPAFRDAMDHLGFSGRDVRAVLAFLAARMYVIVFPDENGHVAGISLVPQQYRCLQCNMLLDMQDDPDNHIDFCLRQQRKIKRNRKLL
jgi:hypothetical protein